MNIGLIAHDSKKKLMQNFCIAYRGILCKNELFATGTTGRLIEENNMQDKVSVNIVGCFGFCSQGPFVKIYPEDTLYRLVKEKDVEEIFQTDIVEGHIVQRLLYVEPLTGEKVAKQDDINFYKKQKRLPAPHSQLGATVLSPV